MDREVDIVKEFMRAREYCEKSGFPIHVMMERIVHCREALESGCVQRLGSGRTSPYYLDIQMFEKKLERGDFKEVMES